MENRELIIRRLTELAERSAGRGIWTRSEFLTLAEQDTLLSLRLASPYTLDGGYAAAERKVASFGSQETCGWWEPAPISCVRIDPVNAKFADRLTHRDFLGSIMALGIRRQVLGDIAVIENTGYLFCLDTMREYIKANLTQVRHTSVRCADSEPPEKITEPPDITELVSASERLDAAVAAVYRLSRSQAQELIAHEKVYLSGRLATSASAVIPVGTFVSVRGMGRFLYEGVRRETKKGRLRIMVRIY